MEMEETDSPAFSLFSSLPPELRNQIWDNVLPENDGPALYPYRRGYWCSRYLREGDIGYDANHISNLAMEFRHDLIAPVQVEMPLLSVNREARSIALGWLRAQRIGMRFREDIQCHVIVRQFDLKRDALYVAINNIYDFCTESDDRLFEPDLREQAADMRASLRRIAVPAELLWDVPSTLPEMLEFFMHLEVLFVIVGEQPHFKDNEMNMHPRWQLENTQGGNVFIWDHESGSFNLEEGELIGDEAIYKRIKEIDNELSRWAIGNRMRSFEIRPVFAVEK